jgi:hypothetical protein
MSSHLTRSVLLGALLAAAMIQPARSEDVNMATPDTVVMEHPVALAASAQTGPIIARESLGIATSTAATEAGKVTPTRAYGYPNPRKRYASTRGGRPAYRHGLILGIGY